MIEFTSDKLKTQLSEVLEFCVDKKILGSISDIELDEIYVRIKNIEDYEDIDLEINPSTEAYLSFSESEPPEINVSDLINIIQKVKEGSLFNTSCATSCNEILFFVEPKHYEQELIIEHLFLANTDFSHENEIWNGATTWNGETFEYSLVQGVTFFHELYELSEHCSSYVSTYMDSDIFIKIKSNKTNVEIARQIANLFIFEIATTNNIILNYAYKPTKDDYDYEELVALTDNAANDIIKRKYSLFPLMYGEGIYDVVEIYNKSLIIDDYDYQILCLTRVIEFISPTIAKSKLNSIVIQKLSNPKVLNPDASFVAELEMIFEFQEKYKRDKELIKLAIMEFTDISELIPILPKCICGPSKLFASQMTKEQTLNILNNLANCITDTRNQIAHAKANYQLKGNECPENEKSKLVASMLIVARQAIRWFAKQPIEKRVVV